MAKKSLWLSYDIEFGGDIESLYAWLDSKGARECANGMAFFQYEYEGDFLESLRKELRENVKISKKDRVYVAFIDSGTDKMKGKFVFGGRKQAPWSGYAVKNEEVEDVDA